MKAGVVASFLLAEEDVQVGRTCMPAAGGGAYYSISGTGTTHVYHSCVLARYWEDIWRLHLQDQNGVG